MCGLDSEVFSSCRTEISRVSGLNNFWIFVLYFFFYFFRLDGLEEKSAERKKQQGVERRKREEEKERNKKMGNASRPVVKAMWAAQQIRRLAKKKRGEKPRLESDIRTKEGIHKNGK